MKNMIIAAMLASSLVSPAVAGDFGGMLLCAARAESANAIMDARQAGVSMSFLLNVAESEVAANAIDLAYANEMILDAYAQKREHTEEDQQRVIEAFESATYLQCARELREEAN